MSAPVLCQHGFPEHWRADAARLYDAAFGAKLGLAIPDPGQRVRILAQAFCPGFALAAVCDGELVGLAGFKTLTGSLTGGLGLRALCRALGVPAGLRAAGVLALFNRRPAPGQMLMDGIAVAPRMRGRGVGTLLLHGLRHYARQQGHTSLRLDVIDTNPDARRLYERMGFVATRTSSTGPLARWLGFGASTTMLLPLSDAG